MAKQMTKTTTKRTRKHTLTDNKVENVKDYATFRLNNAIHGIEVFGNCFGKSYEWTEEQIDKAETALLKAVERYIGQIRTGTKITEIGVQL